ncbi:helix-turn-helix domain-containing protein [Cohnella fermenti]|uniref:helix-turn-helix domain-containing protein n=1 Tax=Cohnella fermenti TaxID=2565925 RepID=UPI001454CBA5|nr:helix-turn-helix domain-containing protein [Cohnella fermenti]
MRRKEWLERLYGDDYMEKDGLSFALSEYEVDRSWELHGHDFYELEFVLAGDAYQRINGVDMPLIPGRLYVLTPVDAHHVLVHPNERLRLINVKFSEEWIDEEVWQLLIARNGPLAALPAGDAQARFLGELRRMQAELAGQRRGRRLAIRYTLNRLLLDLLREMDDASGSPAVGGTDAAHAGEPEQQMKKRCLAYVHRHYREPVTLQQAASSVNLSANYFSEKFHEWVGQPFRLYVLKLRLAYADKLVRCSVLPITDIAYESGFNSLPYFIRAYKQHYGLSPSRVRKNGGDGTERKE